MPFEDRALNKHLILKLNVWLDNSA
uniref:Uncharacterized protein n=1 Tax=Arundo donax TaxID=35708 RepID=A0A0A9A8I8_ARUDO